MFKLKSTQKKKSYLHSGLDCKEHLPTRGLLIPKDTRVLFHELASDDHLDGNDWRGDAKFGLPPNISFAQKGHMHAL